jgi:pimeloyl-ACP methyl ester carboxylesterase
VIAIRVATRHPARVGRLVLSAGIAQASTSLRLACDVWITLLDGDALTLGRFLAWASSSEQAWSHRRNPDAIATAIAAAVPAGTAEQADLVRRIDVRADLAQITASTLVVVPRNDRLVDPAHSAELAAGIANARTVALDSGHDIAGEAPSAWWQAITEHFQLA